MSIQELIQKNKSAVDEYFSALYNATDYKRADIIGVKLSVKSLNASFAKALIDAVIEDEEKADKEIFEDNNIDYKKKIGFTRAKQDTISKLQAIKELL